MKIFLASPAAVALLAAQAACMPADSQTPVRADTAAGELAARPGGVHGELSAPTGLQHLDNRGERSTLLYVPTGYRPDRPVPLVVMLHGAGGVAAHSIGLVERHAEQHGIIVLAPTSQGPSWDIISGRRYGPDIRSIDAALARVFAQYIVDPGRVAVGGFSDGASYALSLGLINGKLFSHVIAFSPGFMALTRNDGRPRVFISHGVGDRVLPIDVCSRRLAPQVRAAGYDLDYREFAGGHTVPEEMLDAAFNQLLAPPKR